MRSHVVLQCDAKNGTVQTDECGYGTSNDDGERGRDEHNPLIASSSLTPPLPNTPATAVDNDTTLSALLTLKTCASPAFLAGVPGAHEAFWDVNWLVVTFRSTCVGSMLGVALT